MPVQCSAKSTAEDTISWRCRPAGVRIAICWPVCKRQQRLRKAKVEPTMLLLHLAVVSPVAWWLLLPLRPVGETRLNSPWTVTLLDLLGSRWRSGKRITISASATVNSARLEIADLWLHLSMPIVLNLFAQYSAAGTCGRNGIVGLQWSGLLCAATHEENQAWLASSSVQRLLAEAQLRS
jgi:hypothetical protein